MDSTKAGGQKAVQPAGSATTSSARVARRTPPLPEDASAAAADAPAAADTECGGKEEDDDEQLERFYALLANIRALRGACVASGETPGGGARKRLRGAEPPWRPAFRLEDFEEPSPTTVVAVQARRARTTKDADVEETGARPAVASSPPPRRAGVRLDSSSSKST